MLPTRMMVVVLVDDDDVDCCEEIGTVMFLQSVANASGDDHSYRV